MREATGLSMKVCRAALAECNNDVAGALEWLQEQEGVRADRASAKLGGRATAEGRIAVALDGSAAGLVELSCETSFVARTAEVEAAVEAAAAAMLAAPGAMEEGVREVPLEALHALQTADGESVEALIKRTLASVGENLVLVRASRLVAPGGIVGGYTHNHGSLAAAVGLCGVPPGGGTAATEVRALGDRIAQHVVATDPDGEPDALLEAPYLFEPELSVQQLLARSSEQLGAPISLSGFVRWGREM